MAPVVRDPSKLTINQLKMELQKQKVSFPKDARKAEYVRLYTTHMKVPRSPKTGRYTYTPRRPPPRARPQRSEFSSDDGEAEEESKTPAKVQARQVRVTLS